MPSYKAIKTGFWEGELHGPGSSRSVVVTKNPLKHVPSWLELISESKAAVRSRTKVTAAQKAAALKKKAEDQTDVDSVTFLDEGNPVSKTQSAVETL